MDIDATIDRHGVALQSVLSDHPYDPPFTYTIGRHLTGEPELIVFGGHHGTAGTLLNELAREHAPGQVRAGAVLPMATFGGDRVRLRSARPEWTAPYGLFAFEHAGAPPWDVPFLQVVLPDTDGALPGEGDGPARCWCCPDLSHPERPYPLPLDTTPLFRTLEDPAPAPPDVVDVCVPVWDDAHAVGRVERLRAQDLGDGTVRLLQPPVLADWTTAGAVLRIDPEPDLLGDALASVEVSSSPLVHLTWTWDLWQVAEDRDACDRLDRVLRRVGALDGVEATIDPFWLAVAAPSRSSHQVRSSMRHLVRDGLAGEAERFSRPSTICTDARCDCCGRPS